MNIAVKEECPLIPMWAITGKPARNFLRERMENFKSVGITQLVIYPRHGLEVEYMSEAWLDICAQGRYHVARQQPLSVWRLYSAFALQWRCKEGKGSQG